VVLWKWKVCCFLFVWIVFSAIRSMHGRFVGSCNDEGRILVLEAGDY